MKRDTNTKESVKPADALGRISERTKGSRLSLLIVGVIGLFVVAFLIGLIVRGVSGGIQNAPDIPGVEI